MKQHYTYLLDDGEGKYYIGVHTTKDGQTVWDNKEFQKVEVTNE